MTPPLYRGYSEVAMNKIKKHELDITELLKAGGTVTLRDAMSELSLSESTVRRAFARLEETGCAVRYHGGIRLVPAGAVYSYDDMRVRSVKEKKAIAALAASEVESGDSLYLDSGTTMAPLSSAIADAISAGYITDVRIYTNSLVNLDILSPYSVISLIGGEYRSARRDFSGYIAAETMRTLRFTKCFLGADGYHPSSGFTATDVNTALVNEIAVKNSRESYVVIDSSKFMNISDVTFSRGCAGMTVITDCPPSEDASLALRRRGAVLRVAAAE
jgi:DeoR family fructose operon transcriptional repressor